MNAPIPAPAAPPTPSMSLAARLMNVFVTPGEVFAEVKAGPPCHQNWLVPALIFVLLSWCMAALLFSQDGIKQQMVEIQDQAMQKQFQKQIDAGRMTQAQADQAKAGAEKFATIGQTIAFVVVPLITAVTFPFWGGFVLWVGGTLVFKRPFPYLKGVEIAGLALMIAALGALVKGLLAAALGNMFATPGPILLVKHYDPTNQWHNLLITLDVFLLWALLVKSVGLAKLSDIAFAKAAAWVVGVSVAVTGAMFAFSWAMQQAVAALTGQGR